jgi:benzoate transport
VDIAARPGGLTALDPRAIIDERPMRRLQWVVVAICSILNGIDGFDVLAITYVAPSIGEAWHLDKATIGLLISSGLAGMGIGSILLAPLADRAGRCAALVLSLSLTATGMLFSALSESILVLGMSRFFSGIGIGLLLAVIATVVAEFTNAKRRAFALSLMMVGYPIGAGIGGAGAAILLTHHQWPAVFWMGAILTAAMIPIVLFFLPDSVAFHVARGRADALDRVNRLLTRLGHPTADSLPPPPEKQARVPLTILFGPDLIRITLTVTTSFVFFISTFYFYIGWLPSIVVDMGFTKPEGASAAVGVTLGGAIGGIVFGLLSRRIGLKRLLILSMILTWITISLFGHVPHDLPLVWIGAFVVGFCMMGAIIGYYSLMAEAFPTSARATGMGFVIGVGRIGAVLAPISAGALMTAGISNASVGAIMALGALLAGGVTATLRVKPALS